MDKFVNFISYLKRETRDDFYIDLEEIEEIIEQPLARSAYEYSAYWSNDGVHRFPFLIGECGFKVSPDLVNKRIRLIRVGSSNEESPHERKLKNQDRLNPEMTQKDEIILHLMDKGAMTLRDLSIVMYGDSNHTGNINESLKFLLKENRIIRTDDRPAVYSLRGPHSSVARTYIEKPSKPKKDLMEITNENLDKIHDLVMQDETYGKENKLITDCLNMFPKNDDVTVVAMKISLIDVTNSTNLSRHKSKISLVELAEKIVSIKDIDERIKDGDPTVVNEIAKANGEINLFSFASKYCCYHNHNFYQKDDFAILDTVLMNTLPQYFRDITRQKINNWRDSIDYQSYNDYISKKLDELVITTKDRKRKFDHFVWYLNR